ncbi:hypothetical protein KZ810_08105 [Sphingomonas sp. RHCKR47]|nr:hypothetical protein [Sphingomonas citricola]MBW6523460.1 hypothetical protein [Sphingomonas citricola]
MARRPASANEDLRPMAHRQFKRRDVYPVPLHIPFADAWNAAIVAQVLG